MAKELKMTKMINGRKVAVIIAVTSDIGLVLAKKYLRDGYTVVGTYRSKKLLPELKTRAHCHLFYCDLSDKKSLAKLMKGFKALALKWDVFISCAGTPLPLQSFFACDFEEWSASVHVNAIEQLRLLHEFYPLRNRITKTTDVVLFAGGGVNNAVINFSAYTIAKIMLIKMCEYLDAENEDLNIFIVGPGWTKTKIHQLVLANLDRTDKRYAETVDFINHKPGTSLNDVYDSIQWLCRQGKRVASGRNFSIVNDQWKGKLSGKLAKQLRSDANMYKLRRQGNDYCLNKN